MRRLLREQCEPKTPQERRMTSEEAKGRAREKAKDISGAIKFSDSIR